MYIYIRLYMKKKHKKFRWNTHTQNAKPNEERLQSENRNTLEMKRIKLLHDYN